MTVKTMSWAAALLIASALAGCGNHANPTAPTSGSGLNAAPTSAVSSAALSLSLSLTGWYSGQQFHYVPTLSVTETTGTSGVSIHSLSFTWVETGARASGLTYGVTPHVSAGGSLNLLNASGAGRGPTVEMTSGVEPANLSVVVSFIDDTGHPGQATATIRVPAVRVDVPAAVLTLSLFTVDGWYDAGRFHYWPRLSLTSSGGSVAIKKIAFELLDVGSAGRVPPSWQPFSVAAGETLNLSEGPYFGDPWFEIDSSADASRVSVVIVFIDEAGRAGEIAAVAQVSRR